MAAQRAAAAARRIHQHQISPALVARQARVGAVLQPHLRHDVHTGPLEPRPQPGQAGLVGVEGQHLTLVAHPRGQCQRLAASPRAEVDDPLATPGCTTFGNGLAAGILQLEPAVLEKRQPGECRAAHHPQRRRCLRDGLGRHARLGQLLLQRRGLALEQVAANLDGGWQQQGGRQHLGLLAMGGGKPFPQPVRQAEAHGRRLLFQPLTIGRGFGVGMGPQRLGKAHQARQVRPDSRNLSVGVRTPPLLQEGLIGPTMAQHVIDPVRQPAAITRPQRRMPTQPRSQLLVGGCSLSPGG